jgi:LacI family transcriptional regulator
VAEQIFRRLKLTDVAKRAGVSTSTVSRALSKPHMVRSEVRARIEKVIDALGYSPNAAARALAMNRSRTIGVVVPTLAIASFAAGVGALQARLSESAYMLQLAISDFNPNHELECVRTLAGRGVDGLVLVGTRHDERVYEILDECGIPFINTWDFVDGDDRPCIGFDNRRAAFEITDYVLNTGHRDVAIIAGGGPQRSDRSVARLEGCLAALKARSIDLPPNMIIEVPYLMEAGGAAVRKLLDSPRPPTAVVCTNDILAVGAILDCQRAGISVPNQVSITGIDNLDIGALTTPSLTTIQIPARQMGLLAAEYLIEKVEGRDPLKRVKLEYALIVRQSVKSVQR